MEFFNNAKLMIVDMLGPFGPVMLVGALGFMMILITLPVLMKKQDDPLDKLKANTRTVQKMPGKPEKLRAPTGRDKLEKYANFLEPQNEEEFSAVKLKLMQAGYQSKNAVRMYHFSQFALGVIGLIIASVVNIFLGSGIVQLAISAIGVVLFAGLTAYYTQDIKNTYVAHAMHGDQEWLNKAAIDGAMSLYLAFLNMFQFLLMFLGQQD